jgi:hypothetical protein
MTPASGSSERTRAIQGRNLVTCHRKLPLPHHTTVEDEDATSGCFGLPLVAVLPPPLWRAQTLHIILMFAPICPVL